MRVPDMSRPANQISFGPERRLDKTDVSGQELMNMRENELGPRTEQMMAEIPGIVSDVQEERNLFKEFGFDEQKFRECIAKQPLEKTEHSLEFGKLFDEFSDASLYTYLDPAAPKEVRNRKGGPNCLAFALGWSKNPLTGENFEFRPVPGDISGHHIDFQDTLRFGSLDTIKKILSHYMSLDLELLGKEMIEVEGEYVPEKGERMIAMMSAPYIATPAGEFGDFHFMLKGEDGMWYHKRGMENPTNLDNSLEPISNPEHCNRGPYCDFEGYFVIRNKEEDA